MLAIFRIYSEYRRDPHAAWKVYSEGMRYVNEGQIVKAERAYREAISLEVPEQASFHFAMASLYLNTQRYHAAIQEYQKTFRIDPATEPEILRLLSKCYSLIGKPREAIRDLEKMQKLYPLNFTSGDAQFLKTLKRSSEYPAQAKMVKVYFILNRPKHGEESLYLYGNWKADGALSDAYGYQQNHMTMTGVHQYEASVTLNAKSDFSYQIIVRDGNQSPVAFQRFEIPPDNPGSIVVPIESVETFENPVLKKNPTLRRPKISSDGRKKIFVMFWDSGTWWFVRPLALLGLMPNSLDMMNNGMRAEMISDPPVTGVAIQKLTHISPKFTGWHTLLLQLKGLPFLDKWIHVEFLKGNSVAGELAAHGITSLDLTFNESYIYNPQDRSEKLGLPTDHLSIGFDPRHPELDAQSIFRQYIRLESVKNFVEEGDMYARWLLSTQWEDTQKKFDKALSLFNGPHGPDVMTLRLPGMDILSHYYFENKGPHTEKTILLAAYYSYMDDLLGKLRETMDADDVLFLISDHGPLDTFRHHNVGLWIAQGPGLIPGKKVNSFPIENFPKVLLSFARPDLYHYHF